MTAPIRILHVVNNLERGGLENGLVNVISRLDPHRFEHVVSPIRSLGSRTADLVRAGAAIKPLFESTAASRLQAPALIRTIRETRPDVVHSRNWAGIEAVFAARFAGGVRAVVHSEHGYESSAGSDEPKRRAWVRRAAFQLADRVVCVSSQLRDYHASQTGFDRSRMGVIHNGVDCVQFSPDESVAARVRGELGIAEGILCVGCVANLLPVKDHLTLLHALDHVDLRGRWHLVLVGEGPERGTLECFVRGQPGWSDRVSFLGSSNRVPDLLRAMDVFVLPSVAEGICNALLEAMATGIVPVVTAVGGNPEVVINEESGLLFVPGDVKALTQHLVRLASMPGARSGFGAAAQSRARAMFSIDTMVDAYDRLYSTAQRGVTVATVPAG